MELFTISAALLYRFSVVDVTSDWYKHVYDKIQYFMQYSDSDNFCFQQLL